MTTFANRLHELWIQEPDKTILRLLHNNRPDQVFSYTDIMAGSAGYTQALTDAGIKPGEIVILLLQHSERLIFSFWGTVLHGAIPAIMPFLTEKLSPDHYHQSMGALFSITTPSAIITYPDFIPEVKRALEDLPMLSPNCRIIDAYEIEPQPDLLKGFFGGYDRKPEDIAVLQHSSGTTGLQKGVALSHQAVFNQLDNYAQAIQLRLEDTIVSWLPLYHDMGLITGFIMPILRGIPLVLLSPFDWVRAPHRLFQAVSQFQGTLVWLPNFAYNFCSQKIRDRNLDHLDLSSLRAVVNCSEPMVLHSHEVFLDRFASYGLRSQALATCYAMAENVFAVTQGGIDSGVVIDQIDAKIFSAENRAHPTKDAVNSLRLLSAGIPIPNTRIRILSEEKEDLPERMVGEIAISSDCLLTEYFRRPDITQDAFHQGWYLTGDLGYTADGELFVTGRKKDLIIVGGKNIYPQDLEYLAGTVDGVYPGRVVAFGLPNEDSGTEDVVIVAEAQVEFFVDEASCQALADAVRFKVTKGSDIALRYVRIVERGWLIKTSSGKVARTANRAKYLSQLQGAVAGRQAGSNS